MIEKLAFKPLPEIKRWQENALAANLQYLQKHSTYYKALFEKHKIDIHQVKTLEDLVVIPTTSKDYFSAHNHDFICNGNQHIIDYCSTSGTTGKPLTIGLTENDLRRLANNEALSFTCADTLASDLFQLMLTLDRQFMAGMAYFLGIRQLGAGMIRVGPASPQIQWDIILAYKPTAIVAVPSFILKLMEYAEGNGIDLNSSGIEKAICIGEAVRNVDLSPNILAQQIHEKWNIKLYSTYASTEMQTAFTECSHGCGGHHQAEMIIFEILDEAGNQLKAVESGELTITTLGIEGTPLLRYRTGDICCYYDEPCACGRNTLRLSPLVGRKNQMIKYKGTTIFPPAIYDALRTVSEVKDYLVEISNSAIQTDEILIHIVQSGNLDVVESKIKSSLQAKLRVIPALNFVSAQHLQSLRPAKSRKPVQIVFKRQ